MGGSTTIAEGILKIFLSQKLSRVGDSRAGTLQLLHGQRPSVSRKNKVFCTLYSSLRVTSESVISYIQLRLPGPGRQVCRDQGLRDEVGRGFRRGQREEHPGLQSALSEGYRHSQGRQAEAGGGGGQSRYQDCEVRGHREVRCGDQVRAVSTWTSHHRHHLFLSPRGCWN